MARPRKFDEDSVLTAAREAFNGSGYHGTSVDALSRATGLSKGSLYGAFHDKESLFRRVFDDYCAASDAAAAALLEGPDEQALERARAFLRVPEGPLDRRGCLLANGTAELAWENESIGARALAAFTTLLDALRRLIEQAKRAGLVDPQADAEAIGGLILATHRGIEALGKAGFDSATLNRIATSAIDKISSSAA